MEWGFQSVCKNLFERYIYYVKPLILLCFRHINTPFAVVPVFISHSFSILCGIISSIQCLWDLEQD
jgi:hypothetical protein